MRDRRYSTAAWQKTRRFVIARDRVCMVRGPKCNGRAHTAHHKLPTSQYPEAFFDVRHIVGCCLPCNRHGGVTAGENRATRMTVAHLEAVIEDQERLIAELTEEVAALRMRRQPAIW